MPKDAGGRVEPGQGEPEKRFRGAAPSHGLCLRGRDAYYQNPPVAALDAATHVSGEAIIEFFPERVVRADQLHLPGAAGEVNGITEIGDQCVTTTRRSPPRRSVTVAATSSPSRCNVTSASAPPNR